MGLCIQSAAWFHNQDADGKQTGLQLFPSLSPLPISPSSKSTTQLLTIPPSYIALFNQSTAFLALSGQNCPSTVCQALAAAVASAAGSSLAHSLSWHGSFVLTKWRPCRCRLDAGRLSSLHWTAVSEGSVKLRDGTVPGYQWVGSAIHVWMAEEQSRGWSPYAIRHWINSSSEPLRWLKGAQPQA